VSFATPIWLLGLALVPLALLAYQASRRRGSRYAVRYTAVPALKVAAGAVPAWRRHLPAALALAALAALVLALAKPQKTVAVPVERASIMLVTDHSRSMSATDVEPDRLSAAQRAARTFLNTLPDQVRVGAVAFSDTPDAVQAPSSNHDDARRIVDGQVADGATATGAALEVAIDALKNDKQNGKRPPSAIVLLSDGKTTVPPDPVPVARTAGQLKIPIYTVALGTRDATVPNPNPFGTPLLVAPDPETLRQIAEVSGGKAFTAEDSDSLKSIYKTLGSQLGTKTQKKQITATFAIGGLVLLLGAAVSSLRWAGRLP
jgi:Ca-activated chloride channel family protein